MVTDAELQTDTKIIGRAYALQAAQFDSFYPRFVEALDAASRGQPNPWDATKFLADSHFKFFAAFARGIFDGSQSGSVMAVATIGATAPGLVVPDPWAASPHTAALGGAQSAGSSLHASFVSSGLPGVDVLGSAPQSVAQGLEPGTAMWSTISPAALQTGGPSLTPGYLHPQTQHGLRCSSLSLRHCSHRRKGRSNYQLSHLMRRT